ncbi:NAD(P)/FAD-dependent oxidoreductase [Chitinophaga sp. S165]|uniref:flavin monoamine oxidase family protein n=1 Tax=Chitinophaga sp. S165 TaxID=2135462 RepID=UPI000D70C366|nr:NAD(P)/FAD-dependent oxidoreductase [Chitinophaga sp. S165]PWV46928.1 monoamine oxidase [Chitinophaga sp. S165]
MIKPTEEIIIIGAGAAGLIAARELSKQYKVTVLEAAATTGGRIKTIYHNGAKAAEKGAEFVHGELPITLGLLNEAGLKYHLVNGQMFRVSNGKWTAEYEMITNWDQLLEQMENVPEDMTMQQFLDQHYPQEQYAQLRKNIQGFVQGFDLADITKVGIKYLLNEWANESEKNFRIEEGYTAMTDFLTTICRKQQCEIITNTTVTAVEWSAGKVNVRAANGQSWSANKLVVTIPLGVLQKKTIAFTPAIPAYISAANDIGWGTVIKTILQFKTPFWEKHAQQIAFILSDAPIPTWWTQVPEKAYILTGWLGGPPAVPYIGQTDEQLQELALISLANIFNETVDTLKDLLVDCHISNWATLPHVTGAYSYGTPASVNALTVLHTPIENTIYFAGEALYNGTSPGTVEAALSTGEAVAAKIKETLS